MATASTLTSGHAQRRPRQAPSAPAVVVGIILMHLQVGSELGHATQLGNWYFDTRPEARCTIEAFIADDRRSASTAYYYLDDDTTAPHLAGPVTVDQTAHRGAWVTLGSWPVPGPGRLTLILANQPHQANDTSTVTASAARATCHVPRATCHVPLEWRLAHQQGLFERAVHQGQDETETINHLKGNLVCSILVRGALCGAVRLSPGQLILSYRPVVRSWRRAVRKARSTAFSVRRTASS
ncbi:hypothetical protein [Streptosporangium sp. NPDC000396]|uniref:hypothetical protein n=1 Tax=Streptosporangium sp. NPDC000396 TaxID=3366185 RepID=UPI00368066A6